MGKPILISSLAAAVALYGSSRAFIPGVGVANAKSSAALRGSASVDAMESEVSSTFATSSLTPMAMATGTLALAALGSSRKTRVTRRAAGANEVSAPPQFNPAEQLGVTAPLGFFDPLGFSNVGDEEGFKILRVAELKHGRVAMMASVGAVLQCSFQFPGFQNVPKGLGALSEPLGQYGCVALFFVCGVVEMTLWEYDPSQEVESIGDFGNPFQIFGGEPVAGSTDMKNRELNNGRAAMIAILGIVVAELATGKDAFAQLGLSAAAPAAKVASAALAA